MARLDGRYTVMVECSTAPGMTARGILAHDMVQMAIGALGILFAMVTLVSVVLLLTGGGYYTGTDGSFMGTPQFRLAVSAVVAACALTWVRMHGKAFETNRVRFLDGRRPDEVLADVQAYIRSVGYLGHSLYVVGFRDGSMEYELRVTHPRGSTEFLTSVRAAGFPDAVIAAA